MNETIIGIDPDSNGAVAIVQPPIHDSSTITYTVDGQPKEGGITWTGPSVATATSLQFVAPGEVDLSALGELLEEFRRDPRYPNIGLPIGVYLERQRLVFIPPKLKGGRSQIAVKTSVTLAKIEYAIRGLLAGMNIPMESIPPGSWKKAFVHGKEPMLPVASRMFPSVVWTGNKLKKEGQATALMLAEWDRREREGRPK